MKRVALLKLLAREARREGITFEFVREGSNHETWRFGERILTIPRHREVNEMTARGIIKSITRGARG